MDSRNKKTQTPAGVYDFLPDECGIGTYLKQNILSEAESWNYERIETPSIEYLDVYLTTNAVASIRDIFKFTDHSGRLLALRPDITTSVARAVAVKMKKGPFPLRLCYQGEVFSFNAQAGGFTQRTQTGVELIGGSGSFYDAEVIALAISSLLKAGVTNFQIEIGQVDFFKGLMLEAGLSNEQAEEVRLLVEQKNMLGIELLLEKLPVSQPLRKVISELPYLFGDADVLNSALSLCSHPKCREAVANLREIYDYLKAYSFEKYLSFDLGMVKSLNYYTGVIFRGICPGVGEPVMNGGRYDGLIEEFGDGLCATGFAVEITKLLKAYSFEKCGGADKKAVVFCNAEGYRRAVELCAELRAQGKKVSLNLAKDSEEAEFSGQNALEIYNVCGAGAQRLK
ncbi:MAG: ATP phosphoribosyltransferase regulatory subunit [Christensenellaceae bacterium]|jgi:ATP phosphoribosyltransferase, regulatory subunit|nr:ATP phosphoribosyltransferase regulatory subunit [Christensenellaceae bacterium]